MTKNKSPERGIEQTAEDELEALALEGLNSGEPVEAGPEFWEEKHRWLDEALALRGERLK